MPRWLRRRSRLGIGEPPGPVYSLPPGSLMARAMRSPDEVPTMTGTSRGSAGRRIPRCAVALALLSLADYDAGKTTLVSAAARSAGRCVR